MRIEELSIGDWVAYENEPVKIKGLYSNGMATFEVSDHLLMTCGVCDIEPLAITPEILKKNGLEYEDDGNDAIISLCCDMFWARLCVGDTFWQVGIHSEDRLDAVVCNVNYTHQLQHALRLAGIEATLQN